MAGDGIFFVLVGPSGAGKNTLIRRVKELTRLQQVPTMTTRPKRENEQEGREHRFVTPERFQQAIDDRELVEWQRVHENDLYGTPRDVVEEALAQGTDLIADIEFLGAEKLYEAFPDHVVWIFMTPSNLQILTDRIMQRGGISPQELAGRLDRARFEMTFAPQCHYLIINDELEPAAEHLRKIVATERSRRRGDVINEADRVPPHTIEAHVTAIIQRNASALTYQGELPRFKVDARGGQLDQEALAHLNRLLDAPLQVTGPVDPRFSFPAPLHSLVSGQTPHFTVDYFYRFIYPSQDRALPAGWAWKPLNSIPLPEILHDLVTQ